jgi:hypothetical protein
MSSSLLETPHSAERDDRYQVPVVLSTFKILEELARSGSLGLHQITQRTGVAKSTAFRVLNTLVGLGYVIRDENKCYFSSPSIATLINESSLADGLGEWRCPTCWGCGTGFAKRSTWGGCTWTGCSTSRWRPASTRCGCMNAPGPWWTSTPARSARRFWPSARRSSAKACCADGRWNRLPTIPLTDPGSLGRARRGARDRRGVRPRRDLFDGHLRRGRDHRRRWPSGRRHERLRADNGFNPTIESPAIEALRRRRRKSHPPSAAAVSDRDGPELSA